MKRLGQFLTLFIFVIGIFGTANSAEWKKVRIATEGAFKPWNFVDASGNLAGFEIELGADLCKRLGLEYEFVSHGWKGIITALNDGEYDAVMAAVSITPDRQKKVAFSISYADSPGTLIVRIDSLLAGMKTKMERISLDNIDPKEQAVLDDMAEQLKGKTIGVQISTTHEKFAQQFFGNTSTIRSYDFQDTLDLELYTERLDAAVGPMSYWVPMIQSAKGREFKTIGPGMTSGPFGRGVGVAVRKKDKELADMFSRAIKETIKDGTLRKLALKWFTFDASSKH